jgi:hypothetical protein
MRVFCFFMFKFFFRNFSVHKSWFEETIMSKIFSIKNMIIFNIYSMITNFLPNTVSLMLVQAPLIASTEVSRG